MTIIGMFAVLSETSAAISLPFLDDDERELYVWFLISFPFYLLLLFFATLNFNHRSLYAPSDFEKGKHFIKIMENTEHSENKTPKETLSAPKPVTSISDHQLPPNSQTGISLHTRFSVEHHIHLPEHVKDLYIIDARCMDRKVEFSALLEKFQKHQEKPASTVMFITCTETETLLKAVALRHSRPARKRNATFYVAYNLSSHELTVIGQEGALASNQQ
jgi:hypothetical protein